MSSVSQTKRLTFAEMVALGTSSINAAAATTTVSTTNAPVQQEAGGIVDQRDIKTTTSKKQNSVHSHNIDSKIIDVATSCNSTVSTDGNSTSSFSSNTQSNNPGGDLLTSHKNDNVPSSVPTKAPAIPPKKNPWKIDLVRKGVETDAALVVGNVLDHPTPAESIALNRVSVVREDKDSVASSYSKTEASSLKETGKVKNHLLQKQNLSPMFTCRSFSICEVIPEVETSTCNKRALPSQQNNREHKTLDECASSSQTMGRCSTIATETSPQRSSKESNEHQHQTDQESTSVPGSNTPKIQHDCKLQPQAKKNHSHHTKPMHSIAKNMAKHSKNMYNHNNKNNHTQMNCSHNRKNDYNNHRNNSDGKNELSHSSNIMPKSDKKWQDKTRLKTNNKKHDKKKNTPTKKNNKGKFFTPNNTKDVAAIRRDAVKQVEYFFSVDELVKNIFMRKHMDVDGFLPAAIVFNFPSVLSYCVPYYDLLEALKVSKTVEVDFENECLRVKGGEEHYKRWLFPNPDGTLGCPKWIISKGDDDKKESSMNDHFEEKKEDGSPEVMSESKPEMVEIQ
jgi:La domain.